MPRAGSHEESRIRGSRSDLCARLLSHWEARPSSDTSDKAIHWNGWRSSRVTERARARHSCLLARQVSSAHERTQAHLLSRPDSPLVGRVEKERERARALSRIISHRQSIRVKVADKARRSRGRPAPFIHSCSSAFGATKRASEQACERAMSRIWHVGQLQLYDLVATETTFHL